MKKLTVEKLLPDSKERNGYLGVRPLVSSLVLNTTYTKQIFKEHVKGFLVVRVLNPIQPTVLKYGAL